MGMGSHSIINYFLVILGFGLCARKLAQGSKLPAEGLVQEGFFEVVEGGEFLAVDGFEANDFAFQLICHVQQFLNLLIRWNGQRELGECFAREMLDASA